MTRQRTATTPDQEKTVSIFGRDVPQSSLVSLVGLFAFFALTAAVVVALWPQLSQVFEEGGTDRLVQDVRDAGAWGVCVLLGLEVLQVVVAFIPGEVVQMAAGAIYGPIWGMVAIIAGCVLASSLVYALVRRLGKPFVVAMVSAEHLDKFQHFEESGKLDLIVFILFLIPGLPKDTFTYLVPLTDMALGRYLLLTNVARIPGVLVTTYAASGLMNGNVTEAIVVLAVVAAIAVVAVIFRGRIMELLGGRKG